MQPKTEELLYFLLWNAEMLLRPTFRNLNSSYESWAYRNGLTRQLSELEKKRFLERQTNSKDERVYRLSEQGRLRALGGRDPEMRWSRNWDGRWRLVLFDIPKSQNMRRDQLRRYLRSKYFGYLQNSVWITPDPLLRERQLLRGSKINVESLVLLEARPCAGESDAEIVAGAWDFARINRYYSRHSKLLEQRPAGALRTIEAARALRRWAAEERASWLKAISVDPLLPRELLPVGYLGVTAWRQRVKILAKGARQLRSFAG